MQQDSVLSTQIPKQRVLIVDDSRIVRATIARLIRKSFDIREEANGEAGWQAIASDPAIVVVVSDIQMPELDGFGLLERIRGSEDPRIRSIPVIVISGDEEEATKKRVRAAGANDFITKTTDGTEILSRIDNLLHLVEAKQQAAARQKAVETTATHDPATGVFTPHYLLTEGRKRYSHSRRHGGALSVLMFRIDTYGEISQKVGKGIADQLLARIAKQVMGTLRAEDSMGRTGEAIFTVIFAGTSSPQALAFAYRLRDQLEKAQVRFREQLLRIRVSMGLAALDADTAASLEELMKLALQRLQQAGGATERIVAKDEVAFVMVKPATLPSDMERAVQTLETANADALGDAAYDALRRLLPFVATVCRRLGVDTASEAILRALKARSK
jgi:two-component system cell cycle response regulator